MNILEQAANLITEDDENLVPLIISIIRADDSVLWSSVKCDDLVDVRERRINISSLQPSDISNYDFKGFGRKGTERYTTLGNHYRVTIENSDLQPIDLTEEHYSRAGIFTDAFVELIINAYNKINNINTDTTEPEPDTDMPDIF